MSLKKNQLFIESRVDHYSKRYANLLNINKINIDIFYLKLGDNTWAYADIDTNSLVFNKKYLYKKVSPLYDWLIGHEVCHIYTDYYCQINKIKNQKHHCERWKNNMKLMGLPPIIGIHNFSSLNKFLIKKPNQIIINKYFLRKYKKTSEKILSFHI